MLSGVINLIVSLFGLRDAYEISAFYLFILREDHAILLSCSDLAEICNSPASASQGVGIVSVCYHVQLVRVLWMYFISLKKSLSCFSDFFLMKVC